MAYLYIIIISFFFAFLFIGYLFFVVLNADIIYEFTRFIVDMMIGKFFFYEDQRTSFMVPPSN